ncbi:glycosyl transferase family 1 [Dyadobacter jejuensis]|uniref:Glycosyl transferase family 1 n=1 Tax=Dyadobacter jejuensis TaxID=1082580 RepID=A0A316AFF3_9BACT|nr:glycosyltransferase [Dyadobacter jejuensis]PWJ55988.1 glycosyl transferase family 1 [Dyadobacter jejuensis]
MKILSVGNMNGTSNTCLHRHWALTKLTTKIDVVNTRDKKFTIWYKLANRLFQYGFPIRLPDSPKANKQILKLINATGNDYYDIIWIDKGITINPETLRCIKRLCPSTKIVSYSPDNMALRHNQSQNYLKCIPLYDIHFTTKSYILDKMKSLGAKRIEFTNKHYESSFHYPRTLTIEETERLGGDVGFIGAWEKERCDSILFLAENGVKVKVFGDGRWNNYRNIKNLEVLPGIFTDEYSKALRAFKISLCFLRKINHDLQTSRSMEIPACGGFMLAERTIEHLSLFEEGKEADYFSSNEELLNKCQYYLENDDIRQTIILEGLKRCKLSGYSNEDSMNRMINSVLNDD